MIVGLGIDIVEIARVERLLGDRPERAIARLFLPGEADYCQRHAFPPRHFAARIAAKEATFKALAGTAGARDIGWTEIEVVSAAEDGRPSLLLHGRAKTRAEELGVTRVLVSLTHDGGTAAAVVVLERE